MKYQAKSHLALLIILFAFHCVINAQEYQFPESATYDPRNDCYYISNFNGNNIIRIDSDGKKSSYIREVKRPLGMEARERLLYVISNPNSVKAFCLDTAEEKFSITIDEAKFLNDLTIVSDGKICVSDTRNGYIFKIDPEEISYSVLCQTSFSNLNGIIYDERNQRLITCSFSKTGDIGEYDFGKSQFRKLPVKIALNLDGITLDQDGNFYFSTWGEGSFSEGFDETAGKILKINNQLANTPEVVSENHYGPADIFFNPQKTELVVPNALSKTVDILKF